MILGRLLAGLLAVAGYSLIAIAGAFAHDPPVNCTDNIPSPDPDCIYSPANALGDIKSFTMDLTDPLRDNYRVPIRVRFSGDATGIRPVVILNHGGGTSENGRNSMPEWGTLFAEAGFVVIHPSRTKPSTLSARQERICKKYGRPRDRIPRLCKLFIGYKFYGPLNTNFIIDNFPAIQSGMLQFDPGMAGTLDANKVIVGGWSGGSTIPIANAGAPRRFHPDADKITFHKSLRPIAFFGFSTMGPDYAGFDGGFQSDSYNNIDARPFLTITGKSDNKGKTSEARTTAFMMAEPGEKYLSWSVTPGIGHSHMAHIASACDDSPTDAFHCLAFESPMLAFLDWVAYGDADAENWLKSDAYKYLTGNVIELQRR